MQATVSIPPDSQQQLTAALRRTLQHKGGDPEKIVKKAAGYVASFAIASGNGKIPTADPQKILVNLRHIVTRSSKIFRSYARVGKNGKIRKMRRRVRASKLANEWRGTLAAVIVATINYHGARNGSRRYVKLIRGALGGGAEYRKAANANAFYRLVAKFAKARSTSAGYLRSGLFPAIKYFRHVVQDAARIRGFKFPPGMAMLILSSTEITASMEDHATGIDTIAPNALRRAETEVANLFDKWILEDMEKAARATGEFTVV